MFHINDKPEGKFLYTETIKLSTINRVLCMYMYAKGSLTHSKGATAFVRVQWIMEMTKLCLLRQNLCHDKHTFVMTNVCLDKCVS